MVVSNPRFLAAQILLNFSEKTEPVSEMIRNAALRNALKEADQHLLSEIVLGVLRHMGLLNHVMDTFVKSKGFSETVRALLQGATYQALFLDRVPDYAIVSETMKSADLFRLKPWDKKFLRGVLGNFFRSLENFDLKKDWLSTLPPSRRFSHPGWIVDLWKKYLPPPFFEPCLKAGGARPPFPLHAVPGNPEALECLRVLKDGSLPFHGGTESSLIAEKWDARIAEGLGRGLLYVQGSSQFEAIRKCPVLPGDRVLEIGAAPGGKTIHLNSLVGDRGKVFALDVSPKRMKLLEERVVLLKLKNVQTVLQDALQTFSDALPALFEHVILDAPCSNLGELCRKPEVRWRLKLEDLPRLQELQKRLASAAWEKVKPGGTLLYMTCTLTPQENEGVRDFIVKELQGRVRDELKTFPLPEAPFGGYACLFGK